MSLAPRILYGDLDLTAPPYMVEFGAMYGSPENVYEVLESWLADGEVVSSTRSSNREIELPVLIEESDFQGMADAESALVREADKPRNTLIVDPGDGWGPPTVFDTFRAQPRHDRSDEHEMAGLRRWPLTIPALPFGRAVTETVETSTAALTPPRTVISDGSTTTGWTAQADAQPLTTATISGRTCIKVEQKAWEVSSNLSQFGSASMARDAASTFDDYLVVDYKADPTFSGALGIGIGSGWLSGPVLTESLSDGFIRGYWDTRDWSTGVIRALFQSESERGVTTAAVHYVDEVATVANLPALSTAKQSLRALRVLGSVRTPGSIEVAAPAGQTLGDTLVFTCPDLTNGFTPNLVAKRTAGPTRLVDSASLSGYTEVLDLIGASTFTATVQLRSVARGRHLIVARVKVETAATVIEAASFVGGVEYQRCSTRVSPTSPASFKYVVLGVLDLPPRNVPAAASGSFTVKLGRATGGGGVTLDEAFLLPFANSSLSIVNGAPQRLWLNSPSLTEPEGAVWAGTAADQSDAYAPYATIQTHDHHTLRPETTLIYVATPNVTAPPTITARHHARAHTHSAV